MLSDNIRLNSRECWRRSACSPPEVTYLIRLNTSAKHHHKWALYSAWWLITSSYVPATASPPLEILHQDFIWQPEGKIIVTPCHWYSCQSPGNRTCCSRGVSPYPWLLSKKLFWKNILKKSPLNNKFVSWIFCVISQLTINRNNG